MIHFKIIAWAIGLIVVVPTVTLGSSFTLSLIQGKTPAEAVQILGEQIDSTLLRLNLVEEKQVELEETIIEVEETVESIQASTTEAIEDNSAEVAALKEELRLEREKDTLVAEQASHAAYCEDLKWAKNMPGKGTVIQFYEDAVSRSTPTTHLIGLKQDYEDELVGLTNTKNEFYSDYNDPDRIEYCESKEWCEDDEPNCAYALPEQMHPETKKCYTTLNIAEEYQELTEWYEDEKEKLSNPDAEEYQKAKALATRLKPQYDEYKLNCI